jgi:ribosomal protein L11 methyltransferase
LAFAADNFGCRIFCMIELRTEIAANLVEPLEEWLNELTRCPWGLTSEIGEAWQLFGYFDDVAAAQTAWGQLRGAFPSLPARPAQATIEDRDWREAYKAYLRPWSAGDLHWVPVWMKDQYSLPAGHMRLLFDAGLAFGTGDHPTTRLMARRLLDFRATRGPAFAQSRVIDAGCGSGILALSAALLGCGQVLAFDRDPEAVRASQENLVMNGLRVEAVEVIHAGIEAALHGRQADLLLANIQADVLALHADDLAAAVAPGGTLAVSGVLATEVDDLRMAFEPVLDSLWELDAPDDLTDFGDSRILGDWCDLMFARPGK